LGRSATGEKILISSYCTLLRYCKLISQADIDIDILISLLTATGLPPGGSSTVHIYTQTIYRTTQKKYIEQHKNFGIVRAMPPLCELYPGICLTTEEKARKNLSHKNNIK
jgi:hypothetical protein